MGHYREVRDSKPEKDLMSPPGLGKERPPEENHGELQLPSVRMGTGNQSFGYKKLIFANNTRDLGDLSPESPEERKVSLPDSLS